jgi:serine/threonine-protein kinase
MKRIAINLILILLTGCGLIQPGADAVRVSPVDGMEMMFVPAGRFEMGSASGDPHADDDESPIHEVRLDGFWIDKTEVTNAMYRLCMDAGACTVPARTVYHLQAEYAEHPVIGVSWNQAQTYCGWASRRLPTEAEWEKAARGTDGRIYPWGNEDPTGAIVNFNQQNGGTTRAGSFPAGASPYGALDMAGNAWEWVQDGYSPDYYSVSPRFNPVSDSPVNRRVLRGGNWDSNAEGIRSANRFWAFPGRNDTDGFRCAKSQ